MRASSGTVEQAQRAYEIADLRYREGLSTQTELLDARVALEQAQGNRAVAARDLQVARMRLLLLPALPLTSAANTGAAGNTSTGTTGNQNPTPSTQTPLSATPIAGVTTGAASAPAGVSP